MSHLDTFLSWSLQMITSHHERSWLNDVEQVSHVGYRWCVPSRNVLIKPWRHVGYRWCVLSRNILMKRRRTTERTDHFRHRRDVPSRNEKSVTNTPSSNLRDIDSFNFFYTIQALVSQHGFRSVWKTILCTCTVLVQVRCLNCSTCTCTCSTGTGTCTVPGTSTSSFAWSNSTCTSYRKYRYGTSTSTSTVLVQLPVL